MGTPILTAPFKLNNTKPTGVSQVLSIENIITMVMGGGMAMMWWNIKRYIAKVDDLENRVVKIETVLDLLGDIKKDISCVKTDVEVIKSRLEE